MPRPTRLLALAAFLAGCATTTTYTAPESRDAPALPAGDIAHEVFLLGNTADGDASAVLQAVRDEMERAGEAATLVFLGDQTSEGYPETGDGRTRAEAELDRVVAAARGLDGQVVVLPGDRDWRAGESGLKRQEDYLEAELGDVLTPGDQAGGPREDKLAEGLRLIALDTAWWLQDERPEGEAEDVRIATPSDVVEVLDGVIADRADDRIVVVGHHPIRSNGRYGGARTFGESALTLGLGPLATRAFGLDSRDLAFPRTRALRTALDASFEAQDGLVYAASHDRALQAFRQKRSETSEQLYLVSGTAGGATDATTGGGSALSVVSRPGYQRLVFFADGSLWAETVVVDNGAPEVVFRHQVAGVIQELLDPEVPVDPATIPDVGGQTVTVAADADFVTGPFVNTGFRRAVFGEGYRTDWKTPVEFEVLDLGREAGGLTPVKRSGGMQTTGLRLQGEDGFQYGLRLLEKGGTRQLPGELRDGLVGDVVLDLRSAMTPYGALVAAPLEEAAGLLTGRPKIVMIPDDPRLGRYREAFANRLALFEVRLDDDVSALFPGHDDLVSSQKLREEMLEDQDHRVDQRTFLRARLLDMLLGDWDRHADQWRWSAREPGDLDPSLSGDAATKGKVYLPVPRDRDFAFYEVGGLIQVALHAFDKRLQPFDDDYGSIQGLTQNGFFQDRRFLNELGAEDYAEVAGQLQVMLTDAAIDRSVDQLPAPIAALRAEDYRATLRARRDGLVDAAERLFRLQARIVDVLGSNERELAEITHAGDYTTVALFSYKGGEKGRQLYRRRFMTSETNEVRVYLFAGRDRVEVRGSGGVLVRVVGGGGLDELDADGPVRYYDTPDGVELVATRGADLALSERPEVNLYDPEDYVPPQRFTIPEVGYNTTDGVLLGAGVQWIVPGFRIHPHAATHTVYGSVTTTTGGLAGGYRGTMRDAILSRDLTVDARASTPRYVRNFYGLGNHALSVAQGSSITNDDARIDLATARLDVGLGGGFGTGFRLSAGPSLRYADARRDTTLQRINGDLDVLNLTEADYEATAHAGGFLEASYSTNDAPNPRQGVALRLRGSGYAPVTGDAADAYGTVGGDLRTYLPISYGPQVTLALRAGAEHRIGDFPFFDAATLGGSDQLRGFRRQRFSGETAAFGSAELRAKLFDLDTFLLPIEVGVLGFADAGRVWSSDPFLIVECGVIDCRTTEAQDPGLRTGFGGGLWFNGLDRAVFNLSVATSEEENALIQLGAGFQF